jgi:hypothetical protein
MVTELAALVTQLGEPQYSNSVRGERHHVSAIKHPMKTANELKPQKAIFRSVRL